jgi:hypothetical protein
MTRLVTHDAPTMLGETYAQGTIPVRTSLLLLLSDDFRLGGEGEDLDFDVKVAIFADCFSTHFALLDF